MNDKIINVQDAFLNYIRKNKIQVTIFLLNGVKMIGVISCFDQTAILLRKEGYTQLLYKHAISTILPHNSVTLFDWSKSEESDNDIKSLTGLAE
ncbi:MAG: RNA chaperone Hfq [Alphaproteobacteria bacterium]|nr:RNA chaperone Hfq [Alphaproteobacteria bacterium]